MTIVKFIKAARSSRNPVLLEHAIIFHEAAEKNGVVHRGKRNGSMIALRKLGYFDLNVASTEGIASDYDPAWHLTEFGSRAIAALTSAQRSDQ